MNIEKIKELLKDTTHVMYDGILCILLYANFDAGEFTIIDEGKDELHNLCIDSIDFDNIKLYRMVEISPSL